MTKFGLNPGFVRLRYDDSHRPHWATYQVEPVGAVVIGEEPSFATKGSGTVAMHTCITNWAAVFKAQFAASTSLVLAEFWVKESADDDPAWVYAVDIGLAGTGGGTATFTRQINRTYRTAAGHILKIVAEGCTDVYPNDTSNPIDPSDPLSVFLLGADNFIQGRDNAFPVARMNFSTKTNDALRKKELGL